MGTISSAGVYSAPVTVPAQPVVTVAAVSTADPTKIGTAAVTVTSSTTVLPTISGTPPLTANVGSLYSFAPTASGPSGTTLSFTIAHQPVWAAFDTSAGVLSGTPGTADAGSYANVTISVSDGMATVSLPAFTITVAAQTTGSATLSWVRPTTRTDGSPLTNLAGFRVYYGTSLGSYSKQIDVPNPALTAYVVSNLPGGSTYYFVATAYDSAGLESTFSTPGTKTIP